MKTDIGHYYVFFSIEDFWKKVNYWKSKGIYWIHSNYADYNPNVTQDDLPCVLNVDKNSMLFGKINIYKDKYFKDELFIKIYNKELRKFKMKKLNEKIKISL